MNLAKFDSSRRTYSSEYTLEEVIVNYTNNIGSYIIDDIYNFQTNLELLRKKNLGYNFTFKDIFLTIQTVHGDYKSKDVKITIIKNNGDFNIHYYFSVSVITSFCGACLVHSGSSINSYDHENNIITEKDLKNIIKFIYIYVISKSILKPQKVVFFDKINGVLTHKFKSAKQLERYLNVNSSNEVGIYLVNLND